jgi:hypothetical protein
LTFRSSVTQFFERAAIDGARWLGVDGFTRALALLLALGLLIVATVILAVAPVWRVYGVVPDSRLSSDRLRVTHSLATHWQYELPDVMFVGGSQIREALPTEAFMQAELSRACGWPVAVFNATSSAQPAEASWALIELLGEHAPPLVVSGVNLWRDDRNSAGARRLARALLPLGAPKQLDVSMGALNLGAPERLRNRMGILFGDALQALRHRATVTGGNPFQGRHNQYAAPPLSDEERIIESRYTLLVSSQTADAIVDRNVATYGHLGEFVRARGGRLLYLLPPSSPGSAAILAPLEPRTRHALAPLVAADEVLDLSVAIRLEDADFYDGVHMLATGRAGFWPVLEQALRARMPRCQPPVP